MTEDELKNEIKRLCAADYDPKLADADITALVTIAQQPDAEGRVFDDPDWDETYDLSLALASGWETKAARAAGDFRFEEDNQTFYREQVYRACRAQADRYNRGMVAVPMVAAGQVIRST